MWLSGLLLSFSVLALWAQQTVVEVVVTERAPLVGGKQDTVVTVVCPPESVLCERVVLAYSLHRPPGGWDPWDRIAYVTVLTPTDTVEIARIMTPYQRECGWEIDVTDFRPLLTDTVRLRLFILYWAQSPGQGYLVSARLRFFLGQPGMVPYRVVKLWGNDVYRRWAYGNPKDPIDLQVPTRTILIDEDVAAVKFVALLTGHGQGNTDNAAEFSRKTHTLLVNGRAFPRLLWRDDCARNPCRPQQGTWQYNRAGWCPGDYVRPWEEEITSAIRRGDSNSIGFRFEPYVNYCSPWWDSCFIAPPPNCPDCNFNSTGHTMPWYLMSAYLVLYRQAVQSTEGAVGLKLSEWWWEAGRLIVRQAYPVLWRWELVDVLGRRLRSGQWWGQQLAIPFFGLPPGIYGLRWQCGTLIQQQLVLWNGD
ncbi:MAG: peptide-N-glycosidase F-related protein [Candidatus Kapabacteria bacterium]|nr:peptide-N-glycosidase F-related protein [Candidatus Kapabacteria bacterium]MDW8012419.1 peptide-N-glycosidase F-related protein [Bacteroidota bacterium]